LQKAPQQEGLFVYIKYYKEIIMTKKFYFLLALACCLLLTAAPALAVDEYGKVYPQEIAQALTDPEHASAESKALLQSITLPASLGITIPRIDTSRIHDTLPLNGPNPDLRKLGYTEAQMLNMDYGDFNNIMDQQPLTEQQIALYASEDLPAEKLAKMTYGEYLEAYQKISEQNYLPTAEQQAQFAARGITLDDARTLLKDFHQYENVLAQDDATLKEYIEAYYQFAIDWILSRTEPAAQIDVAQTPTGQTESYPVITSDGQKIAEGKVYNGVTCLPMRTIFEACGATVDWYSKSKEIHAHNEMRNRWIYISLAERTAELHVQMYEPDAGGYAQDQISQLELDFNYCFMENGTTYLPLRTIAEALACDVQWDAANKQVILQLPAKAE